MAVSNENVGEEIIHQEVVPPVEENNSSAPSTQNVSSQESKDNNKEYNFKQLRETNKQLEERVKKSEETLESFRKSQLESRASSEEPELGEEDLVEGKHLNLAISRIEEKLRQKEMEAIPERLRGKYSDFDQVVTKENLDKLQEIEPELYMTIRNGSDLFAKGVSAYKTLKSLGIVQDDSEYIKHKEQVQTNHKKPLSTQAVNGSGALHEANIFANGLTDELRKQLRKEMSEAAKAR